MSDWSTKIDEALESLEVGEALSHGRLHLFPLTGRSVAGEEGVRLLGEAMRAGAVEVLEVDEDGSVPFVRVTNRGDAPVLVLDGEEFVGAKQDRVANSSVLVPAASEIVLPVSCVERGRWSRRAAPFTPGDASPHIRLRRLNSKAVHDSLARGRGHLSDQGTVWEEVDRLAEAFVAPSPTHALQDVRSRVAGDLEGFLGLSDRLPEGARGVVVAIGPRPTVVELLAGPAAFAASVGKLLHGYALAALEGGGGRGISIRPDEPPDADAAEALLGEARRARRDGHRGAGDGWDVRLASPGITGHALVAEAGLLHAVVFAD